MIVHEGWPGDGPGEWVEDKYGYWVTPELWKEYQDALAQVSAIEHRMSVCGEVDVRTPRFFTQREHKSWVMGYSILFTPFRNRIPRRDPPPPVPPPNPDRVEKGR